MHFHFLDTPPLSPDSYPAVLLSCLLSAILLEVLLAVLLAVRLSCFAILLVVLLAVPSFSSVCLPVCLSLLSNPAIGLLPSFFFSGSFHRQRPLEDIANREGSVFVPRGVDVPCLDQDKDWEFKPCNFREGQV